MEGKIMTQFINFISEKMLHTNTTKDGKQFVNVSIPCDQSKTGFASFGVNVGQVLNATKKDGTVVEGFKSILLGEADKTRKISVATNKKGTNYKDIEVSNAAIAEMFNAARNAYRAVQTVPAVEA